MRNDQRAGIIQVSLQFSLKLVKRGFGNQVLGHEPFAHILGEVQQYVVARMAGRIGMDDRMHLHIHDPCLSQQTWNRAANEWVDAVLFGIGDKEVNQAGPGAEGRIADMADPIRLMERDPAARGA